MFALPSKSIEEKASNNIMYVGGIGRYNPLESKMTIRETIRKKQLYRNLVKDES